MYLKIGWKGDLSLTHIGGGSYNEKLAKLNLTTLEERRWRGDMIQTWRIMTGKDMVKVETWFDLEVDRHKFGATTTRHARQHHAIRPRNYKYEDRGKFFSNRVVQDYNSRVILILAKVKIRTLACSQVVPIGILIAEHFLFYT